MVPLVLLAETFPRIVCKFVQYKLPSLSYMVDKLQIVLTKEGFIKISASWENAPVFWQLRKMTEFASKRR